jgi:hypothetical protein
MLVPARERFFKPILLALALAKRRRRSHTRIGEPTFPPGFETTSPQGKSAQCLRKIANGNEIATGA